MSFPPSEQDVLAAVSWLSSVSGHGFRRPFFAVAALAVPGADGMAVLRASRAGCDFNQDQLAWVGDSALGLLATLVSVRATSLGAADTRRIKLVRNTVLGAHARRLSLASWLFNSSPEQVRKEERLATALEALVGAVFLDSGESLSAARAAAERLGLLPGLTRE